MFLILLFALVPVPVTVGFLDAELFQTILKRPKGEAEEFGGFGDVVVRLLHCLRDQVAFDVFKIDPFGR
jgi:hypothetical protein